MPEQADLSETPASPAVWQAEPTDLRFSDEFVVAMDGDHIVVSNARTGAYRRYTKRAEPVLNQLIHWTHLQDLLQFDFGLEDEAERMSALLDIMNGLLDIGVLMTQKVDWSAARLAEPGGGWKAAMRYINDTRTRRDTIYAVPAEFYEALAQKAVLYRQPSAFYERVDAPFQPLPAPRRDESEGTASFTSVMLKRRTARRYASAPISEVELSTLLYFSWGMTDFEPNPLGDVFVRKTSPSGGSLHPIEVYPIVLNVEGVPPGCYHYSVRRHGLEVLSQDNPASWIIEACGDQAWVAEASVIFLCTAFLPRTAWKYDYSRVARAVMYEVGYTGQSAFLTATWLGLGAFTTAALRDEIFEEMLGLNPAKEPVLSVTGVGQLEPDIAIHARPRAENPIGVEGS
ncbi:hypothetical protein GCM10007907_32210 [Chitinimonas prasina]|uniref:Nitroreductase domain-containing protein n=1 Tax=Chitinimonas prasina TaxID=1434937 RepID=A0ABQ5YMB1_9NEIS|nr:SagB family peptide dehydrogenase [Chitinimonas prasina]GLR14431.1 hypothetical protein GCM10007907_32210 [Chitinimonas prasina]